MSDSNRLSGKSGTLVSQVQALTASFNAFKTGMVGILSYFPPTVVNGSIDPAWVPRKGHTLSRVAYPALWEHAKLTGNFISDAEWLAKQLSDGYVNEYSSGDGSTTFRMPLSPEAVDVFNDARDVIADIGTYGINTEFNLGIDIDEYDSLIIGIAYAPDTENTVRNSLIYPSEFLFSGNILSLNSATAVTETQVTLTIIDNRTIKLTSTNNGELRYIIGIRKVKVQSAESLNVPYIYSGNATAALPIPSPEWLTQLEANALEIARMASLSSQILHVADKRTGYAGGSIAGYQDRALNTVIKNTMVGASVDVNTGIVTLGPGEYYPIAIKAPADSVDRHWIEMVNADTDEVISIGTNAYSYGTNIPMTWSEIHDDFTLTEITRVKIRHYTMAAASPHGLGINKGHGNDIYTQFKIGRRG